MLESLHVPICLVAFLSGILLIVIVQQLATNRGRILETLGTASSILLSLGTIVLAGATIILAVSSRAQIDEARLEFETNQRPWVFPELIRATSGLLSFDQNGAKLSLNVRFSNTGNTPAVSVFPNGILIFDEPEGAFSASARANTQKRRCTAIKGTSQGTELALFPREEPPTGSFGFYAKRAEIEKAKEKQQGKLEKLPHGIICVEYQFTYTKGHHLTANLFSLTSDALAPYSANDGDPPIPVTIILEGTYAD
jgi:hypothetical protein